MHAQPLSPRPTSPAVRSMGVDHSPSATVSPTADGNCAAHATVRPGSGERDAFYLVHLWSRWFGAEYERGHRYSSGDSRCRSVRSPGGRSTTPPALDVYAVVAEHDPPDRDGPVHIGGGFATIKSREQTVAELPDGRFDADALAGDRNAWFWFGVVDDAWRGLGLGRRLFEERVQWGSRPGCRHGVRVRLGTPRPDESPAVRGLRVRPPVERFKRLYEDERDVCPVCDDVAFR